MKKIICLLLCFFFWPSFAYGAAVFDAVGTGSAAGVTNFTFSSGNTSGSDRYLVCGVSYSDDGLAVATLTHATVPMTSLGIVTFVSTLHVQAFGLAAPATGVQTVSVSIDPMENAVVGCMSFTGVHQTVSTGTTASDSQTSGSLSASITVPTNGMGVSFGLNLDTSTCDQTSGQTERYDFCNSGPGLAGFGSTTSSTGSVAMTWTLSGMTYAIVLAVPINPAAAAAAVVRRRIM